MSRRKLAVAVTCVALLGVAGFLLPDRADQRADVQAGDVETAVTATTLEPPRTPSTRSTTDVEPTVVTTVTTTATTTTEASPEERATPPDVAASAPAPSAPPPPPAAAVTTTTIDPSCIDTFEQRCGAFRWMRAPATNRPATHVFDFEPARPIAGEPLQITATVTDPDAVPFAVGLFKGFTLDPTYSCYGYGAAKAYGVWNPPLPRSGSGVGDLTLTYAEPGTYKVSLCFATSAWPVYRPGNGLPRQTWCPGDGTSPAFEGSRCRDPYGEMTLVTTEFRVFDS